MKGTNTITYIKILTPLIVPCVFASNAVKLLFHGKLPDVISTKVSTVGNDSSGKIPHVC
jgi:hypothetical protein